MTEGIGSESDCGSFRKGIKRIKLDFDRVLTSLKKEDLDEPSTQREGVLWERLKIF